MPKISNAKKEKKKTSIEAGALRCFLKRGYHGVSVRDLADEAGVSLGNLYTYYPNKMSLFRAILKNLTTEFLSKENPIQVYVSDCNFPHDLDKMAAAVEKAVVKHKDFFKMTYIDVVEFGGAHIGNQFSDVLAKFETRLGDYFKSLGGVGPKSDVDPAFAFVSAYIQFYYFFVLKHLFNSKNVYGPRTDKQVVEQITHMLWSGISHK